MSGKTQQRARASSRRKSERLARLPPLAKRMIACGEDKDWRNMFLALEPFACAMLSCGISPTPGFGVENQRAIYTILKDAWGLIELTDAEFEYALRLSTPPEYREVMQ